MSFNGPAAMKFYETCSKIGARARKRGWIGPDGHPVWSLEEWDSFIRAVKATVNYLPGHIAYSAQCTADEVQECMDDGYDAMDVHCILARIAPAEASA